MYVDIVKSLPLYRLNVIITKTSDNSMTGHFLFATKSGVMLDIQPEKGIVRKLVTNSYNISADNYYPIAIYGWKGNLILIQDGEPNRSTPNITVYNPETGKIKFLEMRDKLGKYDIMLSGNEASPFYRSLISSNGHILGSSFRYRAAPSTWLFNTETESFEFIKKDSMPIFHQRHNTRSAVAMDIDSGGTLDGMYHNCWWDDNGNYLFEIIRAEGVLNNIVLKGNNKFFIHDSDREVVSATRRIIAIISINNNTKAWYIIDIKNPSVFYKASFPTTSTQDIHSGLLSTTWRNESNVIISTSSWTKGNLLNEPYLSGTTILKSSYDAHIFYGNAYVVGRFGYINGYIANKNYQFTLPIALEDIGGFEKGDIIIPPNWTVIDVGTDFYNNSSTKYLCNFGGINGYSNEDEYVNFITNPVGGAKGYLHATTLNFITYDPIADVNNYVIRGPIDFDRGEFGCYYDDITAAENTTIQIDGEDYFYDNVFSQLNCALKKDYLINIDQTQGVCDISFTLIPNINKPHQKIIKGISNLPTTNGSLLNTTEMAENQLIFAGEKYSGIILKTREIDDSLTHEYSWGGVISFKGSLKISNTKILYYGYMSSMNLIDLNEEYVSALKKVSINNVIPEINWASLYTNNIVFISGAFVRVVNYVGGYGGFGYTNLTTLTSFLLPNVPIEFRLGTGASVRSLFKLTDNSYSDVEAESIFNTYITTNALTRLQGIALLENSVKWSSQGIEPYLDNSGKFIISLKWEGISGLRGLRINELANGSGLWHTANETGGTSSGTANVNIYPKAIFVNKSDKVLSTLISSDYKTVRFTDLLNKTLAGRLVITNNYIVYLDHEHSSSKAVARVISKTNFENAANGSGDVTFNSTINISLNSTSTKGGFGAQGGDYNFFSINGTPRNCWVVVGDYIFVTISSNVNTSSPFVSVIRINVAAGTYTTWCTDTVQYAAKGITYNPDTDVAFITRSFNTFRVENFTTLTPPYLLV